MGLGRTARRLPGYSQIVKRRFRQESFHEALCRLRLLRPGHSVFRHAVHAQPYVARRGPARKSQPGLLRRRAHDVYPGLFFGRTEEGRGDVHAGSVEVGLTTKDTKVREGNPVSPEIPAYIDLEIES